ESQTWETTDTCELGSELSVKISGKCPIWEASVESKRTFSWQNMNGNKTTKQPTKTTRDDSEVKVPPRRKMKAVASAAEAIVDVPFEAKMCLTLVNGSKFCYGIISGTYRSVTVSSHNHHVEEVEKF
ncbi:unnamed protein product, partial [Ectocarpus sp. 12 AP-2014]